MIKKMLKKYFYKNRRQLKFFTLPLIIIGLAIGVVALQSPQLLFTKANSDCTIVQTEQGPGCWCSNGGWKFHCGVSKGEPAPDQCVNDCATQNTDSPSGQKYTCVPNPQNRDRDFGSPCSNNFQFACGADGVKTECKKNTWHDTGECCPKGQVGDIVNCRKITTKNSCIGQCDWYNCADGCYPKSTDRNSVCSRPTPIPTRRPSRINTPTPTRRPTAAANTPIPSPQPSVAINTPTITTCSTFTNADSCGYGTNGCSWYGCANACYPTGTDKYSVCPGLNYCSEYKSKWMCDFMDFLAVDCTWYDCANACYPTGTDQNSICH